MFKNLVITCKFISLLKQIWKISISFLRLASQFLKSTILDSRIFRIIYKIVNSFLLKIKIYFSDSFFMRIIGINTVNQIASSILENSKSINWFLRTYRILKVWLRHPLQESIFINVFAKTKQESQAVLLELIGLIMAIAILSNTLIAVIFFRNISFWGWILRGIFFSLGLSGVFCRLDWQTIGDKSVLLRFLRKKE